MFQEAIRPSATFWHPFGTKLKDRQNAMCFPSFIPWFIFCLPLSAPRGGETQRGGVFGNSTHGD